MERIKVAVSPFYGGENWKDEKTQISFEKNPRGLNVYSIPNTLDLSGIEKAIRLNALILVEGNIGDYNEVEEITIEEPKAEEPKDDAPKEEAPEAPAEEEAPKDEEAPVEEKEEEEVVLETQEEKKPAAKRAPRKKAAAKK